MSLRTVAAQNPPLVSIALISAATLAYEILLMRLFSIIQWHHFAYMMISLALLGYGASGSFLAIARRRLEGRFTAAYLASAALFGITSVACFRIAQAVPFNALEVLWDPRQPLWLALVFSLLFIPFFCAANCICLALQNFRGSLHRVYCFDLLGAGAGAAAIIALLFAVRPEFALQAVAALGLLAVAVAMLESGARPRWPVLAPLLVAGLVLTPPGGFELQVSEFKGLSQALQTLGARKVDERSSPLGLLTTVANPAVPYRQAPGLSLNSPGAIPEQLAVYTDADALSVLTRFEGRFDGHAYLDYQPSALPYHLLDAPRVLVLGAGGGADVLQALYHGAAHVDAVELNGQFVELVNDVFGAFTNRLYEHPDVSVHQAEARGFVVAATRRWDLVQVALLDSFNAASAGLYALSENYLYTREALATYLEHLEPGGILAITRWTRMPPRDGLKIFATAAEVLRKAGVGEPGAQLLMIRSWNTSTLLVRNEPFTGADIERLKAFCDERWFDLVHYPGMNPAEANRYNQLPEPWYFDGARALLGPDRAAFMDAYKFDLTPATDNMPYFSHFLKLGALPELLALKQRGGLPLLEWGYLVLIATLVMAALASFLLVLLPLWLRRGGMPFAEGVQWRFLVYFAAVGTAFMFVEIAFIQKFVLFLHHPLYAVSVVLCAFLVFAGLGSLASARWSGPSSPLLAAVGIGVLTLAYTLVLPSLFDALAAVPGAIKLTASAVLIAPLAFLMGMPFPLGLDMVAGREPAWIPWAWGINGCASVVSAVLAMLLAIHLGFVAVVYLAVALYVVAGWVMLAGPGTRSRHGGCSDGPGPPGPR